jgi:hypothetical protein
MSTGSHALPSTAPSCRWQQARADPAQLDPADEAGASGTGMPSTDPRLKVHSCCRRPMPPAAAATRRRGPQTRGCSPEPVPAPRPRRGLQSRPRRQPAIALGFPRARPALPRPAAGLARPPQAPCLAAHAREPPRPARQALAGPAACDPPAAPCSTLHACLAMLQGLRQLLPSCVRPSQRTRCWVRSRPAQRTAAAAWQAELRQPGAACALPGRSSQLAAAPAAPAHAGGAPAAAARACCWPSRTPWPAAAAGRRSPWSPAGRQRAVPQGWRSSRQ